MTIAIDCGTITVNGSPIYPHWEDPPPSPSCRWITDNVALASTHYRLTIVVKRADRMSRYLSRSAIQGKKNWNSREPIVKIDSRIDWAEAKSYIREARLEPEKVEQEKLGTHF